MSVKEMIIVGIIVVVLHVGAAAYLLDQAIKQDLQTIHEQQRLEQCKK